MKMLDAGGIPTCAPARPWAARMADQVQVGIRGLISSICLTDLTHKVRSGMAGVVRDWRHAGGRAYGYRPIRGRPGELEIVEEEAAIVWRIFREYADGAAPREIAAKLNADGIAPPRGCYWASNTINGNHKRLGGSCRMSSMLAAGLELRRDGEGPRHR